MEQAQGTQLGGRPGQRDLTTDDLLGLFASGVRREILLALARGHRTGRQIADALGRRPDTVRRHLERLHAHGLVQRHGPVAEGYELDPVMIASRTISLVRLHYTAEDGRELLVLSNIP